MIKLKDIITQLDTKAYKAIEQLLKKNKADNLLFLLESYRQNKLPDEEIIGHLQLNSNSFYVLKSRLHDKIEHYMSGNIHTDRELVLNQLYQIPDMCFQTPREIAVMHLQKLEKDLLPFDMHNELLMVYAALKKMYLYSNRYFYYSQLYNKHVALSLSLEKSEEILGNFNRILAQYYFSRSGRLLDELAFLRKEVLSQYALNPSRQIEIIKNFIELQLCLFCDMSLNTDQDIEETLHTTARIFDELPVTSQRKNWRPVLDYLYFEYYRKIGQPKSTQLYYERVNASLSSVLLYSSLCNTSRFMMSKISYLQDTGKMDLFKTENDATVLTDPEDPYSGVVFNIYKAMRCYHTGHIKDAIALLNGTINENSFKDYFHMNMEIKFTLLFFYIHIQEYDIADSMLKSIYRKIKSEAMDNYVNALDLVKVFTLDIAQNDAKKAAKQRDAFTLFLARNNGEYALLPHLQAELKKKYL